MPLASALGRSQAGRERMTKQGDLDAIRESLHRIEVDHGHRIARMEERLIALCRTVDSEAKNRRAQVALLARDVRRVKRFGALSFVKVLFGY